MRSLSPGPERAPRRWAGLGRSSAAGVPPSPRLGLVVGGCEGGPGVGAWRSAGQLGPYFLAFVPRPDVRHASAERFAAFAWELV